MVILLCGFSLRTGTVRGVHKLFTVSPLQWDIFVHSSGVLPCGCWSWNARRRKKNNTTKKPLVHLVAHRRWIVTTSLTQDSQRSEFKASLVSFGLSNLRLGSQAVVQILRLYRKAPIERFDGPATVACWKHGNDSCCRIMKISSAIRPAWLLADRQGAVYCNTWGQPHRFGSAEASTV